MASAMNRRSSFPARYEGLGVIPIAMIGIGMVSIAGLSVLPLGDEWGFLASVLTVGLIGGGVFLLFVYLTGYGAIWLSRKLATTTRLIAVEPEPPPPTEPIGRCPAWRVTLSDGPHTVYLEDDRASPKRLACDGRWVDLVWPDHLGRAGACSRHLGVEPFSRRRSSGGSSSSRFHWCCRQSLLGSRRVTTSTWMVLLSSA